MMILKLIHIIHISLTKLHFKQRRMGTPHHLYGDTTRKNITISKAVDEAICEICKIESSTNVRQSYSKIANYLIALGVDRYNALLKRQVKPVNFDFGKYDRRNIRRAECAENYTK